MKGVAVVTGGSSGIGLCVCRSLRDRGYAVYEMSRRDFEEPGITHICADVTDDRSVNDAVSGIMAEAGRIDILVSNAGFGISGAVEFTSMADAERQLDVNFFGAVRCVKAVLPIMRRQGGGRIVCTSSVAAPVAIPFQAYYSVSKAAINSFVQALQCEVRPFGISVCAVMPGDIRTGFTAARKKTPEGDAEYSGRISRSVAVMEHDEQNGMAPEKAGAYIAGIAVKRRVKPLYAIGIAYKAAAVAAELMPCGLRSRIVGMIYAK